MTGKALVPLIDIVFLSLASLLGVMSQMQMVEAIEVDISEVGAGGAQVEQGEFLMVTLTPDGLFIDGASIQTDQLEARVADERVVLRAASDLATERTLAVLSTLTRTCASVTVEVQERRN